MPLRGHLDFASLHCVIGWAQDIDAPDTPVSLVVSVDEKVVGRVLADRYRPDLEEAAIGCGRHAFDLRLTALSPWARHTISVRREGDGAHLPRSPFVLEPASAFDQAAKDSIAQLLSTFAGPDDLDERLQFLLEQTAQLRQLRSNLKSGATDRDDRRWRLWNEASLAEAGAAAPPTRRRALVVTDRIPLPNHDSQSNALLSHICALQRLGFDVSLAPVDLAGDPSQLEAAGVACCLYPWFTSIEDMLRRQRNAFALVYLHRVTTAARYVALVRDHQPHARVVYGVGELLHLRQTVQAGVERRPELAALGERTRLLELTTARQTDAVLTHSTEEAVVLRRYMNPELVHVVPWSVPPRPTTVPFADRHGLAFIGSYENQANVDAATRLVGAILPALDALGTRAPCLLVGSDMPSHLKNLRRDRVEPLGQVDDLAGVFDRVRLTVAPLAFGAGVKGKVLDSLAAGVPCVCTPAATHGLDLPEALTQLVAESPADFARAIQALHDDEALNRTCREAGLAYIRAQAGETQVDAALRAAVDPHAAGR